jgi:hypothetical protein
VPETEAGIFSELLDFGVGRGRELSPAGGLNVPVSTLIAYLSTQNQMYSCVIVEIYTERVSE